MRSSLARVMAVHHFIKFHSRTVSLAKPPHQSACKEKMTFWQTLSAILLSLALRLFLERRTVFALTESLLLFALIQYSKLYRVPFIVTLIISLASAFCQTEIEYYESVQERKACDTPPSCTAKSRNGACPARNNGLEKRGQHYYAPQKAQSPKTNDRPEATNALHGRVTMFPCDPSPPPSVRLQGRLPPFLSLHRISSRPECQLWPPDYCRATSPTRLPASYQKSMVQYQT